MSLVWSHAIKRKNAATGVNEGEYNHYATRIYFFSFALLHQDHTHYFIILILIHINTWKALQPKKVKTILDYVHRKIHSLKEIVSDLDTNGLFILVITRNQKLYQARGIHFFSKQKFLHETHP